MDAILSRRLKTGHITYKSATLERSAPQLAAPASGEAMPAADSIRKASARAEEVILDFKKKDIDIGNAAKGNDEEAKAKKHYKHLLRNRHTAAVSRARRHAYTKSLEAQLFEMERQYREAERMLQEIRKRNWRLEIVRAIGVGDHHTSQTVKPKVTEESKVEDAVDSNNDEDFNLPDLDDMCPEVDFMNLPEIKFEAPQSKTEELLIDLPFCQNMDSPGGEVPETLPECFRYLPIEDTDMGDESIFL